MFRHIPSFLILVLVVACCLPGCGWYVNVNERSGSLEDDYVGEPLTDRMKKYERALEVSNAIVRRMSAKEYEAIYDDYFLPELRSIVPKNEFMNSMRRFDSDFGPIVDYKPDQWGFTVRKENGRKVLYSTKIVRREKGFVKYHFVFQPGSYENLSGFYFKERTAVAAPGQL